jgi:hypothetical protein
MASHKESGNTGEQEVVDLVRCPNCKSELMKLPVSFPLFDVQCTRCLFRAQVKTSNSKPSGTVRGAGWDIYEKVLKAGHLSPPLIVNYHWRDKTADHHEIRFYPFVAKENVQKYTLAPTARRANYRMFNYIKLNEIPYIKLI